MSKFIASSTESASKTKPVKRGNRQTRFLAQSVILEEAGISGLIRVAMFTIVAVICGFIYWASITNVDEIAVTAGEVFPTGQVQSVQHLEGGIISDIIGAGVWFYVTIAAANQTAALVVLFAALLLAVPFLLGRRQAKKRSSETDRQKHVGTVFRQARAITRGEEGEVEGYPR